MLIYIMKNLRYSEVKWVTVPCGTGPAWVRVYVSLTGPDPHGSGFTSPLRETDHDLDSASLDRYPETMFPAFYGEREHTFTSCRDGSGAR